MSVPFDAGGRPCSLDSAPKGAAGGGDQHPLFRGPREFCSEVIARNGPEGQGKISVERRRSNATRAKASGCALGEVERDKAVSPRGTRARDARLTRTTIEKRHLNRRRARRQVARQSRRAGGMGSVSADGGRLGCAGDGGAGAADHRSGRERCVVSLQEHVSLSVRRPGWPRASRAAMWPRLREVFDARPFPTKAPRDRNPFWLTGLMLSCSHDFDYRSEDGA